MARGGEVTYTTSGGTRVVSKTKFLIARKLNLSSTNGKRHRLFTHKLFWFTYHWAPPPLGI